MRYLLNSAVITCPGDYSYRLVTVSQAKEWLLSEEPYTSTIGYQETADALSQLFDLPVLVNRTTIRMVPGDEALVFRLILPPGDRRVAPGAKGSMSIEYVLSHCEIGVLRRFA